MNAGINTRRLGALIRTEFLQMSRDVSSILIAFALPLILLFLFGYGLSLDARNLRIGVVLEDGGEAGLDLMQSFAASHDFSVTLSRDKKELEPLLTRGTIRGIVVIPQDFSKLLAQPANFGGRTPQIQIITDGSEPNPAQFVENYARALLSEWSRERAGTAATGAPGIRVDARTWYNPDLESRFFLIPGSLAIIMSLIGTILTSLVVAREWERGTMEALMATPVGIVEIVAGKIIPYFALGIASMILCTAISMLVFDLPLRGSLPMLLVISSFFLFAALGEGLFISTISKNQFLASQLAILTAFMPAVMLSGAIYEISAMPGPIRVLAALIPAKYLVSGLKTLFLVGDVSGVLWPDMAALAGFALFFFVLTALKTKKRLE